MTRDNSQSTPLLNWHRKRGGRIVGFAGWRLPVFYEGLGVVAEHLHTREQASLFDVSHMAQLAVDFDAIARLSTADARGLDIGECKYAALLNDGGGVVDDFIVANDGGECFCVFNASRKAQVVAHLRAHSADAVVREYNRALLAVQGPRAADVVGKLFPQAAQLGFMRAAFMEWNNHRCRVCRCGYTGEDGFEIAVDAGAAETLADAIVGGDIARPAGLGARDSLRLEAGLCLYGNELNENTTPLEAGLAWIVGKERLQSANFCGADILRKQKQNGTKRKLIGLLPQGKIPVRGGAQLMRGGDVVGEVSSGLFSPTLNAPVAMGYVRADCGENDAELDAAVRGKKIKCKAAPLPFVKHRYHRAQS